jgi:hypothetical protein
VDPRLLTAAAIAAAVIAIIIGWNSRTSARLRRAQRRHDKLLASVWAARFEEVRLRVEGSFAIHGSDTVWHKLLTDHPELRTKHGGAA